MTSRNNMHVILTDFEASLDLRAIEAGNYSMNNYAIMRIFFIVYN